MHGGIQTYGGVNSMLPNVELTYHSRKLGVFEHMGCWRYQGGIQMHGWHPNIWGATGHY